MQNEIVDQITTSIFKKLLPKGDFSKTDVQTLLYTTYTDIFNKELDKNPSFHESIIAILANKDFEMAGKHLLLYTDSDGTITPPEGAHWDPIVSKLKALWGSDKKTVHAAVASSSTSSPGASMSSPGASSAASCGASSAAKPKRKDKAPSKGKGRVEAKPSKGKCYIETLSSEDEDLVDQAIAENESNRNNRNHNVKNVSDYLSDEPIWKLPKDVNGNPLFPEPPESHTQAWRKLDGTLSGFKKGSKEQTILAHAWMYLHYVVPKQYGVFKERIPATSENGEPLEPADEVGGPYLVDRKTYFPHPDDPTQHTEVIIYGEMQMSKSPETAAQAHTCLFLQGILPCIFVRVRGGAEVGSADMKGAVEAYNDDVKTAVGKILPHYGFEKNSTEWAKERDELAVRQKKPSALTTIESPTAHIPPHTVSRFSLVPRLTSRGQTLSFNSLGELEGGNQGQQVLIACSNAPQLKVFFTKEVPKKWQDNGCSMPLLAMMGGSPNSPYPPFLHDPLSPPNEGINRPRPRIGFLFDEADILPSVTGNGALERILFSPVKAEMDQMRAAVNESFMDDTAGVDTEDEEDRRRVQRFQQGLEVASANVDMCVSRSHAPLGLKDGVAVIYCYTATPGACHNDIVVGRSSGRVSEANIETVTLPTPPGYCGFHVGKAPSEWWRRRFVCVVELPDRAVNVAQSMSKMALDYFQQRGFTYGEVPPPFTLTSNGVVSLKKRDFDDVIEFPDGGEKMKAKDVKELYTAAQKLSKRRSDKFEECDGSNIDTMGKSMTANMDGRIEPFCLGLIINNFTRTDLQKRAMAKRFHKDGDEANPNPFAPAIVVQYSGKYISITFRSDAHSRNVLGGVVEDLAEEVTRARAADENKNIGSLRDFLERGHFVGSDSEQYVSDLDDLDSDDCEETTIVEYRSSVANINAALSLLEAYQQKRLQTDPKYKQVMVVLAGEIGARGTRYKTIDHKFYLTDMYNSFDAIPDRAMSVHAAQEAQLLGRINSMLSLKTNVFRAPTLWTPSRCWMLDQVFLSFYHELPIFTSLKEENESMIEAVNRILCVGSPHASLLPAMHTLYAKSLGTDKKGKSYYLHPVPQKKKARGVQDSLRSVNEDKGLASPVKIDLDYDQEEVDRERRLNALRAIEEKGVTRALAEAFPDEGSSSNASEGPDMPPPPSTRKRKAEQDSDAAPVKSKKLTPLEQRIDVFFPQWKVLKYNFKEILTIRARQLGRTKQYPTDMVSAAQYCVAAVVYQKEHGRLSAVKEVKDVFELSKEFLSSIMKDGKDGRDLARGSKQHAIEVKNDFLKHMF
tara:strand:- start:826 stop:4731 length:3906 start_codon:yes stop_codon:yes gene_type:complete